METKSSRDISSWYQKIVIDSGLADYSPVKGCMVIKPYGYAVWEKIQKILDQKIKETGHQNAYFPLFIPESFLKKEKEHLEGFSPELAVVTYAGGKKLKEKLIIRPTSETIIYAMFSKWISSYRDLPFLINQWANVVRWELRTRPFLRTTEFLWQEGHTAHSTHQEAEKEALKMLGIYQEFIESYLAIPVLVGRKSESEKFAGAVATYTLESMMQDKKALQMGTSHDLGQNFAKVFDIQFLDKNGKKRYVYQTSWGVSTRLIGALILVHGDEKGLILPPKIAPIQIVIVPIWKSSQEKKRVLAQAKKLTKKLGDFRVKIDERETVTPGFKFNDWEQKGVPLRIEIGPKDLEKRQVVFARRDNGKKSNVSWTKLNSTTKKFLDDIQKSLFKRAKDFLEKNTYEINSYDEFKKIIKDGGFIKAFWCGKSDCEEKIKKETTATIRVIPFKQPKQKGKCIFCKKASSEQVIFARAY